MGKMSITELRKKEVIYNLVAAQIERILQSGKMTVEEMQEYAIALDRVQGDYEFELKRTEGGATWNQ